jgi:hypothetical protein
MANENALLDSAGNQSLLVADPTGLETRRLKSSDLGGAGLPTSLGPKTGAGSLSIVGPSDGPLVVGGTLENGAQPLGARPANVTAYAANQAVNIAPLAVTAATNANPSVVTINAHGLQNGQAVNISGAVGNTAINGTWLVANVTANTFTLTDIAGVPVAGNGVWSSGGSLILLLTFPGMSIAAAGRGYLTKMKLALDGIAMIGNWRLMLYSALVAPIADQAVFTVLKVNNLVRAGYIDIATVTGGAGSDGSFGEASPGSALPSNLPLEYTTDQNRALYGILSAQGAATPISGGTGRVVLSGDVYS